MAQQRRVRKPQAPRMNMPSGIMEDGIPIIDPGDIPEEPIAKTSIMKVREKHMSVRIRSGPGTDFEHLNGQYLGKGVFEIDEVMKGSGSASGWGHLTDGRGWIGLDFVEIID